MKYKLKIKKYKLEITDENEVDWAEEYKKLEAHHKEETEELIKRIEVLEEVVEETYSDDIIDDEWGWF